MKNLGKIILLVLMSIPAFAGLSVSVDTDTITRGERVAFTLKLSGSGTVKVPPFDNLCGVEIESRMQSRKDVYSNGERAQELSLTYVIMPQKSCVIEPFSVSINDVATMTKAINITVSKMSIQKNETFNVTLETDKRFVYVGEPFEMLVTFKKRLNVESLGESISLPESKNIWIKSEHKGKAHSKGGYKIHSNMYAMAAQQSGKLSLGPLQWDSTVRSKSRDYWGSFIARAKTHTVFSNELNIEVKPLPDGIDLVGDLKMQARVDKNEINAGEAVNLTITVQGRANIEDIPSFTFRIEGAQAFNEEPKISHYLQDGKYVGSFEQKSALVAQKDFIIPSFELSYMDVLTDTVKSIHTEAIHIKVINQAPLVQEDLKISRPTTEIKDINAKTGMLSLLEGFLLVLGGFVLGLIVSYIPWKKILSKNDSKTKVSIKQKKEVLQLLLSNMDNNLEIEDLVKKLSENLYEGKSHTINEKRLKEILKGLQTS
ncbi:BatD family protein [Sulfurimonas sp. MAG313]|nr:BatD family protein [Sulfurimonas sp. MAG313]MDF1881130.1 BatD family protein [Sulfurimonas sp. MAG313]